MAGDAPERAVRLRVGLALLAILAIAAALRFYGMVWDGGMLFHPDERHILVVANGIAFPPLREWHTLLRPESPWNPQFFAYGSLPIYLLRIMADLAGQFEPSLATLQSSYLVGRTLSALFDYIDLDSHLNLDPDPATGAPFDQGVTLPADQPGHGGDLRHA